MAAGQAMPQDLFLGPGDDLHSDEDIEGIIHTAPDVLLIILSAAWRSWKVQYSKPGSGLRNTCRFMLLCCCCFAVVAWPCTQVASTLLNTTRRSSIRQKMSNAVWSAGHDCHLSRGRLPIFLCSETSTLCQCMSQQIVLNLFMASNFLVSLA